MRGYISEFAQERILDLFVFEAPNTPSDLWKSDNFGYKIWQNCNGTWGNNHISAVGALIPEDSSVILGREAILRRKTGSLEEYMRLHAYLMDMEPSEPYQCLRI